MAEREKLLRLERVTKRYDAPAGDGPTVLREVSLDVAAGESLAIVGPSGSGKSTLLSIIGALDRPTSGRVWLEGADLAALGEADLARIRNRRIGFVFQLHHLLPQLTALENVLVPALAEGRADEALAARARALLARVGLEERLAYRPGQLSGGERQRVAVARALIHQPPLVLADEPTGSLDREASDALSDLLVDLNRNESVTLIVVTHAMRLAERMGRVLELRDGALAPWRTDG